MSKANVLFTLIIFFSLLQNMTFSQKNFELDTNISLISGTFPKVLPKNLDKINVGGFYRFIGNYTDMSIPYPEFAGVRKKVFIGDDSQLPQLMLQISGKPSPNTSFSTDIYFWTPLSGNEKDYVKGLNLGVNLTGNHNTKYGNFSVKTGGIHWYSLSSLTFGSNTGYNRYSLFERNPWDPNTEKVDERYNRYYNVGAFEQDVRWGQQAFQGIIFDGNKLPKDFSFAFMYGKTQLNGGAVTIPNFSVGGKIKKNFGNNFIALNTFTSQTYTDSLTRTTIKNEIHTFEFLVDKFGINFSGELGLGQYTSPTSKDNLGEAINLKLVIPKKFTFLPIELHYYRISPKVINNNGVFWNTSVVEHNPVNVDAGSQTTLFPFASSMLQIGQMTNNRQGIELNSDLRFKKFKVSFGYSVASEIGGLSNKVAFTHPVNNLTLSRFWRWGFPPNVGPYGQLNKVYRGVYETIDITDSVSIKGFNSFEFSLKYSTKILNKDVYFFYLGSFRSVQSGVSALPRYSDKAYLRTYFHQLEMYVRLNQRLMFTNYFGVDRIIANDHTVLDVNSLLPKNQTGISYATGIDYIVSKNVGLYLRHRWFTNKDIHFVLDKYKGMETTVELKIFF